MEPELLTIDEVAHLLRMSRSTAYALVAAGRLPTVRVGSRLRVRRSALEAWVQRLPEGSRTTSPTEPDIDGE